MMCMCFQPILTQDSGLAGVFSQSALGAVAGVKLEAVMEQLQRQQQAKLDMERKERHLSEAHILYAQQLAAQHAIMASARAQGIPMNPEYFSHSSREQVLKSSHGPPTRVSTQSSVESAQDAEDEEEMNREQASAGEEDEDEEMMEGEDGSEDDVGEGLEFLRKQSLALQQQGVGIASYPYPVYAASPAAAKKRAHSPPPKVKDEPEGSPSPTEQHSFNTPNGLADWSFEDSIKQVGLVHIRVFFVFIFSRLSQKGRL